MSGAQFAPTNEGLTAMRDKNIRDALRRQIKRAQRQSTVRPDYGDGPSGLRRKAKSERWV